MALLMTATDVQESGNGVWCFALPPHQVQHLGKTSQASGSRSVLLFEDAKYDHKDRTLSFSSENVVPINIGTSNSVIGILANFDTPNKNATVSDSELGRGDREFLSLCHSELSPKMAKTAELLISEIRATSPGDLKRGQSRNFSNVPDNFWYVIVQPRIDQLSFTVRGQVEYFRKFAKLPVKDDRGNTLFKLTKPEEIPEAIEIIFKAKRKI